jgi:hypothetical protein
MGLQNATARALAVPDVTTTVLTLTITSISAHSAVAGGVGSRIGPRLVSILSVLLGGLTGELAHSPGAGGSGQGIRTWPSGAIPARTTAQQLRASHRRAGGS